jgi:chitodextrinase
VAKGVKTYTATGLTNGTAYTFTVKAVDTAGNRNTGTTVTKTPVAGTPDTTPPANVTGLAGTPGNGQVVLSWTDPADGDLDHIEVTWTPSGTTPQTVAKGTGTYTATGLTNGTAYTFTVKAVDTAENRNAGTPVLNTPVAPGTPVDGASDEPNIKLKFEGSKDKTEKAGVEAAFLELSAYIKNGGLDNTETNVIKPGNYIDLEGGLEIADADGSTFSSGVDWNSTIIIADANRGKLSRLIVVGINSFKTKGDYVYQGDNTDNPSRPHVVFQFQNIPVEYRMNDTSSNKDGYPESEMRKYLTPLKDVGGNDVPGTGNFLAGLKNAGVPEAVLWGPSRVMATADATDKKITINDLLWLPTLYEMLGETSVTAETEQNQPQLAYYNDSSPRKKVDKSRTTDGIYWLASGQFGDNTAFYTVKANGRDEPHGAATVLGVAPAFCVQGWIQPQP